MEEVSAIRIIPHRYKHAQRPISQVILDFITLITLTIKLVLCTHAYTHLDTHAQIIECILYLWSHLYRDCMVTLAVTHMCTDANMATSGGEPVTVPEAWRTCGSQDKGSSGKSFSPVLPSTEMSFLVTSTFLPCLSIHLPRGSWPEELPSLCPG